MRTIENLVKNHVSHGLEMWRYRNLNGEYSGGYCSADNSERINFAIVVKTEKEGC